MNQIGVAWFPFVSGRRFSRCSSYILLYSGRDGA